MIKITLIDRSTNQIIEEFAAGQEELAHKRAIELEKLDINVDIEYPSSMEQLGHALGASGDQITGLKSEMQEEINSHQE